MSDKEWSAAEHRNDQWWTERAGESVAIERDDLVRWDGCTPDYVPIPAVIVLLRASHHPAWLAAVEEETKGLRQQLAEYRAEGEARTVMQGVNDYRSMVTQLATTRELLRDFTAHGVRHAAWCVIPARDCDCGAVELLQRWNALEGAP